MSNFLQREKTLSTFVRRVYQGNLVDINSYVNALNKCHIYNVTQIGFVICEVLTYIITV